MPLPEYVDENGYLGAILGRSIQTVRCRTVDLEAPASAEILIEGHVALDDAAVEGPMGEYPGYIWLGEGKNQPVYHVTALSYRNDPILPVVVAGEPVEENHTTWDIPCAAQCLSQLRDAHYVDSIGSGSPLAGGHSSVRLAQSFEWNRA
jgi:UbiD family decarboxylase